MLRIAKLTYLIGGRTIFEDTSLSISEGQKIGLVGSNGSGKSTLLKLIAGEIEPDSGSIEIAQRKSVAMVRQDLPEDETKLIDIVLSADKERHMLLSEAETATSPEDIGRIYTRLEEIDAYQAPSRAAAILSGLGFSEEEQSMAISRFSGGWRMRVALAAVLFCAPDLLMLDEPTNHLDFEAMAWLENYLVKYDKTLIIVSHDRDILNKTVTHIAHVSDCKIDLYTGSYDEFEKRRAERLSSQQALHEQQMAHKARIMKFVDRFRAKASKAKQAQSRLKEIERMDIVSAVMARRARPFTFPQPDQLYSPMIVLDGVEAGYEGCLPVLKNLNFNIDKDDRIALLGANGNGKSTLIKLISGRLKPLKGELRKPEKLKIGYFSQHQGEELDLSSTPYEIMRRTMNAQQEPIVRSALGRFGFDKSKADTKISELSGGEKSRLLIALMSFDAPHIMLFDEPTNHLDMEAREALIQALNEYAGAIIIVSHDAHFVRAVADTLWLVAKGSCNPYDGDISSYSEFVISEKRNERSNKKKENSVGERKPKQASSTLKLAAQIERLETEITRLTKEQAEIDAKLCELSQVPHSSITALCNKRDSTSQKIEEVTRKWMAIQEEMEGALM